MSGKQKIVRLFASIFGVIFVLITVGLLLSTVIYISWHQVKTGWFILPVFIPIISVAIGYVVNGWPRIIKGAVQIVAVAFMLQLPTLIILALNLFPHFSTRLVTTLLGGSTLLAFVLTCHFFSKDMRFESLTSVVLLFGGSLFMVANVGLLAVTNW